MEVRTLGRKEKSAIVALAVVVLLGVVVFYSATSVPVNSVGVKYSDLRGTISKTPLYSGLHFKVPFVDKITSISTELRTADVDDVQVTTQDAQRAIIDIELQYSILPEDAVETFRKFRSTPEKDWIKTFLYQRIQRGVQEAASKYTVNELMGEKRGAFQAEVDATVASALEDNHLTMHTVSVDDIVVSEAILQAIEEHAKARQGVETAKQQQIRQEVENETNIAKAESEARIKEIKAEAEASANRQLAESITPELVLYLEALAREKHGWYKYNNMQPSVMAVEE